MSHDDVASEGDQEIMREISQDFNTDPLWSSITTWHDHASVYNLETEDKPYILTGSLGDEVRDIVEFKSHSRHVVQILPSSSKEGGSSRWLGGIHTPCASTLRRHSQVVKRWSKIHPLAVAGNVFN